MCEERKTFHLGEEQWDAFVAALNRPPEVNERLARLFAEPSRICWTDEPERSA